MERMPSIMSHNFSQVPSAQIERSTFNRSHRHITTFNAGKLVPFFVDEALPGDTFTMKASGNGRLATPIFPIMDNMYMDTFFFAVPYRLVWDNWQKFCGEQTDPSDSTDYLIPTIDVTATEGSVYDYMGIPTGAALTINALPLRAYNLIYNEWFRDENLQDSATVDTGDGPDSYLNYLVLRNRGKRHDYFTSCLPWPQKGDAVSLPLTGDAPIRFEGTTFGDDIGIYSNTGGTGRIQPNPAGNNSWDNAAPTQGNYLYAYMGDVTAATVNSLRQAIQVQRLYERDARGGTRYTEIVLAHFGVRSPDARMQRPEYLGGNSSPVRISAVAQTSETGTTPQGNLSAFGTVQFNGAGFSKSFTEHCFIIGLVCVRADLSYQQGLNRMWSRQTRWDHYWPALAHLGEQAVLSKEIYADGTVNDDDVFGYQEAWAEYRYKPSIISGAMRSNAAASLDSWHLAQDFATRPTLNSTFIIENPPIDRVVAVPSEPDFIGQFHFDLRCDRPMPVFSVPGLMDHF